MKRIFTYGILLLFMATGLSTKAQNTSLPNLFNDFPNVINCSVNELEKAFSATEGNAVLFSFSGNTNLSGLVTSSTQRYNNLKSVIVKLNNLQGAIMAISKRTNDDNSISYVGRIINEKFADAYELKINTDGNYYLNKIKLYDILQDHE